MTKMTYTKLFHRILRSSIWEKDDQTRLVWITLMASTDQDGVVTGTIAALARDARVPVEACQRALAAFLAPDPESLTPDNEGRRIEAVAGGWRLLNHGMFRDMMSDEARRQYYREKRQEYRDRERAARQGMVMSEIVREQVDAEEAL